MKKEKLKPQFDDLREEINTFDLGRELTNQDFLDDDSKTSFEGLEEYIEEDSPQKKTQGNEETLSLSSDSKTDAGYDEDMTDSKIGWDLENEFDFNLPESSPNNEKSTLRNEISEDFPSKIPQPKNELSLEPSPDAEELVLRKEDFYSDQKISTPHENFPNNFDLLPEEDKLDHGGLSDAENKFDELMELNEPPFEFIEDSSENKPQPSEESAEPSNSDSENTEDSENSVEDLIDLQNFEEQIDSLNPQNESDKNSEIMPEKPPFEFIEDSSENKPEISKESAELSDSDSEDSENSVEELIDFKHFEEQIDSLNPQNESDKNSEIMPDEPLFEFSEDSSENKPKPSQESAEPSNSDSENTEDSKNSVEEIEFFAKKDNIEIFDEDFAAENDELKNQILKDFTIQPYEELIQKEKQGDFDNLEFFDISNSSHEIPHTRNESSEIIDNDTPKTPDELANSETALRNRLKLFKDLPYSLRVSIGSANVFGQEIEEIAPGQVIKITKNPPDSYDLFLGDFCIAKCEIIKLQNSKKGIKILETMI